MALKAENLHPKRMLDINAKALTLASIEIGTVD